jgi:replication factor C subunit 1
MLKDEGRDAVQDVIDFMDSYYLTKDDFDAVMELGVGAFDMDKVKIESATKAQFTRLYNAQSHPMPFVKASHVLGMAKAGAAKREKPDLEEAVDESEGEEALADAEAVDEDDELDLKKDKYINAPKKKKTARASAGGDGLKAKGKGKKAQDDESQDESEEAPAKKRGSAASGRGRGRGGGRGRGRGKA